MKIGILSRQKKLYSTRRLVEAAEKRGHTVQVIDPLRCYMNISTHKPTIHYRGSSLTGFDLRIHVCSLYLLALDAKTIQLSVISGARRPRKILFQDGRVEPIGIEPTTSGLQSQRSPN